MRVNQIIMPENVVVEESTFTNIFGRFYVQPLEVGYGVTLGNSLRRILLSSLSGTAIVAIKVNDAQHEFTTLKGVVEDLSEIILNLKEIRFKDLTKKSTKIEFTLKGQREFTGKDIQNATSDFEILNPDLHIATLNKEANLDIELRLAQGFGYVPSEENKKNELPLGFIAIDSIFSPVVKVNYIVEDIRVGQRTDFEKLTLEIETDGSLNPEEALISTAKILRDHVQMFINLKPEMVEEEPVREEKDEQFENMKKILLMPVDELDLSVRSQNCLRSANIKTIGDLVRKDESEMLHYRNFGRKSLAELGELIESFNLSFGMDVDKYINEETT
ncbi:MAG: DNA-directed RNA polymerase subunit alpha [Ignavibacteriaceae bacterium]|jgi:DNA-directed RNA polymerase subunit alpha (EC 2.7.7.6)|nr:MAG: DNA-directed RNA polymerase subunit alpha [Chlorobiota bacterium]KXK06154.1 MAG: DNA-directed RNA polymerase subunit alpha [Chlorobi bacterium OLB4]MBV6398582.1 DNA-directed RNA polymerase subunit alpha [Ignavibacteria bacterium]MCC6885816.1 DNA-directed RNA polymerase subunit alpha [Ignavibacteriales bacterium]MCE7952989.1 DNA-directed RNA polymerase subunit alpha [Chlorobi bacterium CHB7]MDL1887173.1 DNA-directed RNA polymerase subunit alpha [Ignavibacteria bacterium CHB1]MEB2329227